ncbi:hypothetical protein GGX14DRAFT_394802 [Mycena pura]|uniref:Uncharacterized protein n=1 Tax=Mycena pura TaxID=153505 RepID=A0AAD6VFJ0_9AGAR|nr:hypothetical protein GGX14DRAFT_394802 [Mycena pura]
MVIICDNYRTLVVFSTNLYKFLGEVFPDAALRGPDMALLTAPHPVSRDELMAFTGQQCVASANAFGLAALAQVCRPIDQLLDASARANSFPAHLGVEFLAQPGLAVTVRLHQLRGCLNPLNTYSSRQERLEYIGQLMSANDLFKLQAMLSNKVRECSKHCLRDISELELVALPVLVVKGESPALIYCGALLESLPEGHRLCKYILNKRQGLAILDAEGCWNNINGVPGRPPPEKYQISNETHFPDPRNPLTNVVFQGTDITPDADGWDATQEKIALFSSLGRLQLRGLPRVFAARHVGFNRSPDQFAIRNGGAAEQPASVDWLTSLGNVIETQ